MARVSAVVIVIYVIGMMILLGLTIKDLYPLFVSYFDDNTSTEIHVAPYNLSTIETPPLVLCLAYEREGTTSSLSRSLNELASVNGSVKDCSCKLQVWLSLWNSSLEVDWNAYPSTNDYKNAIKVQILKDLFYDHINENVFGFSSSQFGTVMSRQVFDAAWDFLNCLNQIDAAFPNGAPSNCTSFFPPQFPENWRIQTVLDRILDEASAMITCYQPNTVSQCQGRTNRSQIKSMLSEQALLSFDYLGQMCFSLPVAANGLSLASARWRTNGLMQAGQPIIPFKIYEATPESMLQALTQSAANGSAYRLLYQSPPTDPGGVTRETVDMQYRANIKVTETRDDHPCFTERDRATCISKCKVEKIVQNCSCIPFAYRNTASPDQQSLPYCNPDTKQFRKSCTPAVSVLTKKCEETCGTTACSYTFFDWQISSSVAVKTNNFNIQGGLALTVTPVTAPYLQFYIVYKQTLEQFLSNVFGIFNFYVGLDGLCLCAFVVILTNFFGGPCSSKPKPSAIDNEVMELRASRKMFEEEIGAKYATKHDLERMRWAFTEQREKIDYLCRLTAAIATKPRGMRTPVSVPLPVPAPITL